MEHTVDHLIDGRGALATAPPPDPVHLTCHGAGSPPLPVLTRVQHVLCGAAETTVWPALRHELRTGAITTGDLVLLRIGRGADETWLELAVTGRNH